MGDEGAGGAEAGARYLFIAAYYPAKNQSLSNIFDFHLTSTEVEIKFYKRRNEIISQAGKKPDYYR